MIPLLQPPNRNQQGFSLIELLVVAVVFSLMVLMVDAFFATVNRSSHTVEAAADIQQNARVAVERLSREAREATATDVTFSPDMVVFPTARPAAPNDNYFCIDAAGVNFASQGTSLDTATPTGCKYLGDYSGTYGPKLTAWVVYWRDSPPNPPAPSCAAGTGSLYRAYMPQANKPTDPPDTSTGSKIATCVSSFTVTIDGTDRLIVTLTLQMAGTVSGAIVPPQTLTVTSTTFMRN